MREDGASRGLDIPYGYGLAASAFLPVFFITLSLFAIFSG
jgi:hypothetical protein